MKINNTFVNVFFKKAKDTFLKTGEPFTAEKAWCETTYGQGQFKPVDRRIKEKKYYIRNLIRNNASYGKRNSAVTSKAYRCVVDFEEDLKHHIDEILQPFIDGGFSVINLSERIDEINDEHVYLISWRHVFDKNNQETA